MLPVLLLRCTRAENRDILGCVYTSKSSAKSELSQSRQNRKPSLNQHGRDAMPGQRVELNDQQFALISKALADPKRFQILQRIADTSDTPTCSCVRDWTGLAAATVSHHLKELALAGLIHIERHGKFAHLKFCRDSWNAYLRKLSSL
jgi:ArsR family transcriptional regulator, arsenate/arsenite/antimonite-responsive transcriptional repressor